MFFYEWDPLMSNQELAECIEKTLHYTRTTGPTEEMHYAMKAHLRDLLAEQARRARAAVVNQATG